MAQNVGCLRRPLLRNGRSELRREAVRLERDIDALISEARTAAAELARGRVAAHALVRSAAAGRTSSILVTKAEWSPL